MNILLKLENVLDRKEAFGRYCKNIMYYNYQNIMPHDMPH